MDLIVWNIDLARKAISNKQYLGVTEKVGGVCQKKVMPEKNQGLWHKGEGGGSRHSFAR